MRIIYEDVVTKAVEPMMNPLIVEAFNKSHLEYALQSSNLTVKKKGKEIAEAVGKKLRQYESLRDAMTVEFAALANKMEECGLEVPEFPKYDVGEKDISNRMRPSISWSEMSSTQSRCFGEYDEFCWKIRNVNKDIASAHNIIAMLEDEKTYPLNVETHGILFG